MARHTIQIPINKSSNDRMTSENYTYVDYREHRRYYEDNPATVYNSTAAPSAGAVSTKLYNAKLISAHYLDYDIGSGQYLAYFSNQNSVRFGIGWNPVLIPQNKTLISAKVYFYSTKGHNKVIYYSRGAFNEGSIIPSLTAYGSKYDGIKNGWDFIDVGVDAIVNNDHSSLIFRSDFVSKMDQYNETSSYYYYECTGEYWELYSHRDATRAPYIELVYDDYPPEKPSGLTPTSETLNPRAIIRFAWKHNSPEGVAQKSFELQWSSNGGSSWTTVNQTSTNEYYDMPASTLPTSGTITWRVRTIDLNDSISDYNTATFTAGVVPQKSPIPISPIGAYKNRALAIRFEWVFVGGATGETQSKFDFGYSTNNGNTWTTISQTTSAQYYELPANSLNIGSVAWRVRTYNEYNEVSPYSEGKYFAVIGTPGAPLISTITNTARPLILWTSSDQMLIDLEITQNDEIVYKTGLLATNNKSHKVSEYLDDGNYTVKIRISNAFEMWSSWAEKSFTISTVKPTKPVVTLEEEGYFLTLAIGNTSDINLVYRDGELIGEAKHGIYKDYTGANNHEYSYIVRVIDNNDNYNESDPIIGAVSFKGNTIAVQSSPEDILIIKNGFNGPISKSNEFNTSVSFVSFDGRELPVAEYHGKRTRSKTIAAFFSKEERDKFHSMLLRLEPLIFRDNDGDVITGVITGLQSSKNFFGYESSFTINEIEV